MVNQVEGSRMTNQADPPERKPLVIQGLSNVPKLPINPKTQAQREQLSLLVRLGIVNGPDPIPPPPPEPKPVHLAYNQRLIGGKVWTFTNPNAMKRRV